MGALAHQGQATCEAISEETFDFSTTLSRALSHERDDDPHQEKQSL